MRGPEIRFRIKNSIDTLERENRDLRASRELEATKAAGLAEERERLYHGLTALYLPELGQQAIDEMKQRLPVIHRRLEDVLRAKREELRKLDQGREEKSARRNDLIAHLDKLTDQLEELAETRDRLTEAVSVALAADPRHAELALAVEQVALRREQAQRRYKEALLERDEKVPEYEGDALFGYLLRRRYRTPQYNPSRWTRWLDGWVAEKVNFARQSEKYRLLQEMPAVAQTGLAEDEQAYEKTAARLRELERSIEDLHGLTQVVERGEALYEQRQALVDSVEEINQAIEQATERLKELESSRGQYYAEAREALSDFLESRPIPRIRELALSTATRKDDRLAEELARWEDTWAAVQRRRLSLEQSEQKNATRLDELRQFENRFRGKDFDASNSTFSQSLDFDRLLESFLAGGLTVRKLWEALAGSQRFEPTRYQTAGPIIEAVLWEVVRQAGRRGGFGGLGRSRGGSSGGGGRGGGFGGFGGGSRTTGGFG